MEVEDLARLGHAMVANIYFQLKFLQLVVFLQFQVILVSNCISYCYNLLPLANLLVPHTFENIPGPQSNYFLQFQVTQLCILLDLFKFLAMFRTRLRI